MYKHALAFSVLIMIAAAACPAAPALANVLAGKPLL
jgi:hypothetical protein